MKTLVSLLFLCVAGVCLMLQLPGQCVGDSTSSPILLIPGLMGSRLNVLDSKPFSLCSTSHKYKKLWINLFRILLYNSCTKREMMLVYDANTNSYHNNTNVKISVPGFGQTNGVEYLSTGWINFKVYMHDLVEYFVDRGYERGKTIRSAPYDWRLAADELEKRGYFNQLKSLVEEMYKTSGKKVTLVVHSMGGPVSLHFLTGFSGIDQAWKDKHINAYVPLAGAWSGGVATLQTVVSGAHGIPDFLLFANEIISDFIVPMVRTFESLPWLFPRTSVFGNDVLISTPSRQYTANDYSRLFSDIGYTTGYRTYRGVQSINPTFPAPNVPTYCYYGVNVKTPTKYTYGKNFNTRNSVGMLPTITYGDGDGSVNIKSSEVCHRWSSMPSKYPFMYRGYDKVDHIGMLKNHRVFADIASIVRAPPPKSHLSV